jgi:ligand-binding sensor domain-containing protein
MNKRSIITLLLTLATVMAHAQLTSWRNISSKNFVMKIIHDQRFLYVGTKGGGIVKIDKQSGQQTVLKRADGSMTGNAITDMALHNGELWVGTEYNGLARVTDDGMEKYDKKNAGFHNNQYFSGFFFYDDGTMLVGSIASLYAFNGKKCTATYDINPLSPYSYVKKIRAGADGRIWVSCYDALNSYNLCVFTPNELMPYNIPYGKASNIETDKDKNLWIATNNGLVKFDGNDFTHYTPDNSALPEANITDLTVDEKGNLWLMGDRFITKYDGTTFTAYPYQLNVANDYLLAIDADADNVYVGSRFEGLLKLTDNGLEAVYLIDNVLYENTMSYSSGCIDADGNFYVGSLYGLQKYNIDTGHYHFEPMSQTAQTEADRNGNVWILWPWFATDTCLMQMTATGRKTYMRTDYPFSEANAELIRFDRKNRLWMATDKGLYMHDGDTWTVYNKSNSGLSFEQIQSMAFDSNNRLWCGTFGGGLFCFDGTTWSNYTTSNSSLPSNYVGLVMVDNNNVLWLNCRDPRYPDKMGSEYGLGLTRFDSNSCTTYNSNNSPLPSNCFWDMQADADNRLWIATAGDVGIVCHDGTAWAIYDTDNSGIALNEVTKITLDSKRDLIWLTHYPGLGLSVARMNCKTSGICDVLAGQGAKPRTAPTPAMEGKDSGAAIAGRECGSAWYSLDGRRLDGRLAAKGVYIVGGRKVVVK